MRSNREIFGFSMVLIMACCLALVGFAVPASAKPIVVTTLTDTADPPFNANGACGTGTLSDLPGADGLVSLREAIIAANNTLGTNTITFAPNLSGGIIVVNFDDLDADAAPDPLPVLCGGQARIKGDLNGDDIPDITLEGAVFPAVSGVAGLLVLSSHNTIQGLQVQHFPFGIRMLAGDLTNPGTITHTTVTNNTIVDSTRGGFAVRTGNVSGSLITDTSFTHNRVTGSASASAGIAVAANFSAAGSVTAIAHTTITDNEVTGTGKQGILILSFGAHNAITDATIARNTVSAANGGPGIVVVGGFGGAAGNTTDVRIKDNLASDNLVGILLVASEDNSSNNRVVARVEGNTVERNQLEGIAIIGGWGAENFPAGTSSNSEMEARIERNTIKNQNGVGIQIFAGIGNLFGSPGGVADHNHVSALIRQNVVEDSAVRGIELVAGGPGVANANTLEVQVKHNTVCDNTGTDILGEGGFTGNVLLPAPNQGGGNELEGAISKNTATTVTVADGTPGNTTSVTQFNNDPCP